MLTQSFSVDVPKIMFKGMYRDFCEAHDYKIPDQNDEKTNEIFNDAIDLIWEEYYGADICAFLDEKLPEYFDDLEWDDSIEQYKYHTNYWATRGISDEVVNRFDLGFDVQQNMVVFPIRDLSGKVAMITKRSVTSKYFYIEEARSKPVYLLYDIIKNNIDKVYVVESQINALTLWTWGYPAIALIGTGAEEQYKILRRSGIREYILCFDGDVAGDSGRRRFIKNMSDEILISVKELPRSKDVNDLTKEQFDSLPEKLL